MPAFAFSNNDVVVIAWTFDRRLDGCLGFAIYRCAEDRSNPKALPALARFESTPPDAKVTTEDAPVQKFWWKDLHGDREHVYVYKIVPMTGTPGHLAPMKGTPALWTAPVKITADRGIFRAYFNRGIVATQAVSREFDSPNAEKFRARISDVKDPLRERLMGQLYSGVTSLLDEADDKRDSVRVALYELNDPQGLERRLGARDRGQPESRTVILGNEWSTGTGGVPNDACAPARQRLKEAGVAVLDRMVPKGRIPHNKFVVLSSKDKATSVLTGSTNWTSTGLAAQTNNALVIKSPRVAAEFAAYWEQLRADTEQAKGDAKKLQSKALRTWNREHNARLIRNPIVLEQSSGTLEPLFSPNTPGPLPKKPKAPNDMARLFELVKGARDAVLFLAFDPGNNSILDAAAQVLRDKPHLFVRGALTNAQRATNFQKALDGPGDQVPKGAGLNVAVIGEAVRGKPRGRKAKAGVAPGKASHPGIDYRAIPAGAITADDAFGSWEAELYRAGFAIIHNKIVVIDPFSDDCVVITGSHNLGYRASHNNDENMVIIHGNKPLAEAYACHVLDLYDHYAWRYWLKRNPKKFGRPLDETDKWQDRYIEGGKERSPELRFWLSGIR